MSMTSSLEIGTSFVRNVRLLAYTKTAFTMTSAVKRLPLEASTFASLLERRPLWWQPSASIGYYTLSYARVRRAVGHPRSYGRGNRGRRNKVAVLDFHTLQCGIKLEGMNSALNCLVR